MTVQFTELNVVIRASSPHKLVQKAGRWSACRCWWNRMKLLLKQKEKSQSDAKPVCISEAVEMKNEARSLAFKNINFV